MERISIIVPVYKVEAYLDRCVQSIIDQTYPNLEIILVDDGSPDDCPAMCDAWAEKNSRIKVIHKKNGGLSDARNTGIKASSGDYIGFVDSDDWIEPDMYQQLFRTLKDSGSDIASGGVRRVYENSAASSLLTNPDTTAVFSRTDAMKSLITESALVVPVWNKLYTRRVVDGVLFPVGKINEDEFWSWRVIARADKVAVIPTVFYNYLQRGGSIMSQQVLKKPLHALQAQCERYEYIEKNMPELKNLAALRLMYMCLFRAQVLKSTQPRAEIQDDIAVIKKIMRTHRPDPGYIRAMSLRQRVRYEMIQHCFSLTCTLQNRLHIGI